MHLATLLGFAGVALAVPQGNPNSALCSSVSHRPGGCTAPGQPSAKAFCSSFLKIPVHHATTTIRGTSTQTVTSTAADGTTTVTGAPFTNTVTSTSTITVNGASTTVVTSTTSTSTVTITGGVATACAQTPAAAAKMLMKRAVPKPVCLNRYGMGAELTSACRCFPISTQTNTVTRTGAKTTVTTTTTVGGTATVTSTPVVTSTIVSTSTVLGAGGVIVTSTSTVVATSTTHTNAVATVLPTSFAIAAAGGGIDGTFADAGDNNEDITTFGPASGANAFYINAGNNYLIEANGTGVGLIANEGPAGGAPAVFWDDSNTIDQFPDDTVPITCTIAQNADDTCALNCDGPFGSNNNYCDGVWYLSDDASAPCVNNFDTFAYAASP